MIVEVESNENCEASVFARFKEIGPGRPINQVKLYDRNPFGEWCWITGWSDDERTPVCPAYAQLVEDSGAGLLTWSMEGFTAYGSSRSISRKLGISKVRINGENPTFRSPATVICTTQTSSPSTK